MAVTKWFEDNYLKWIESLQGETVYACLFDSNNYQQGEEEMAIDPYYNCRFNDDGTCIPRTDQTIPIEQDRITLVIIDHAPSGEVLFSRDEGWDSYAVPRVSYAKLKSQKIDALLRYKDEPARYGLFLAWPGNQTQDIFSVAEASVIGHLKRLGWVDPKARDRICGAESSNLLWGNHQGEST